MLCTNIFQLNDEATYSIECLTVSINTATLLLSPLQQNPPWTAPVLDSTTPWSAAPLPHPCRTEQPSPLDSTTRREHHPPGQHHHIWTALPGHHHPLDSTPWTAPPPGQRHALPDSATLSRRRHPVLLGNKRTVHSLLEYFLVALKSFFLPKICWNFNPHKVKHTINGKRLIN